MISPSLLFFLLKQNKTKTLKDQVGVDLRLAYHSLAWCLAINTVLPFTTLGVGKLPLLLGKQGDLSSI